MSFKFINLNTNARSTQSIDFALNTKTRFPCNFGANNNYATVIWNQARPSQKWLEINDHSDPFYYPYNIVIIDYLTNSSIDISIDEDDNSGYSLYLTAPKNLYSNAKGMLVNGCPKQRG